jgi:hypothetical protein
LWPTINWYSNKNLEINGYHPTKKDIVENTEFGVEDKGGCVQKIFENEGGARGGYIGNKVLELLEHIILYLLNFSSQN